MMMPVFRNKKNGGGLESVCSELNKAEVCRWFGHVNEETYSHWCV